MSVDLRTRPDFEGFYWIKGAHSWQNRSGWDVELRYKDGQIKPICVHPGARGSHEPYPERPIELFLVHTGATGC